MKKYSFLVYHKEYASFLEKLQELGVVHIIESNKDLKSDLSVHQFQQLSLTEKTIKFLEKRLTPGVEVKSATENIDPEKIIKEISQKQIELEQNQQNLANLKKELAYAEPWGDFDTGILNKLKEKNVEIFLFSCPEKRFDKAWQENHCIEIVNKIEGRIYFVYIRKTNGTNLEIPAEPHVFPERPSHVIKTEIEKTSSEIKSIEQLFDGYASRIPQLISFHKQLANAYQTERAYINTINQADNKIKILEGWIPKEKEKELLAFLDETKVCYLSSDPEDTDNVPVVLKNNKYARLYEPIGSLFSLPDYREMDLTFTFAPFYTLFYGMCQADAGYGLLLFSVATFGKLSIKMKELRPILTLVQILSVSTFIFGILSGSFFGILLTEADWPFLSFMKDKYLDSTTLFYLSMKIGIVHIIYALSVKAYRRIRLEGFIYSVNTLGWIVLFVSNIIFHGFVKGASGIDQSLAKIIYMVFMGISSIMILFFSDPKKNPLINFGLGLWDAYGMITGVFGDILSYIRLFALGTSGAILGLVFNNIALSMSPDIPVVGQIVFILIVVFGHGINLFMSSLGSFVHPMRLTFIEFYKNAGFAGGGKPYIPFSKIK